MNIDVSLTANQARPMKIKSKTSIVLDILRATSTIVTALANGCHSIVPASSPEEAIDLATITDDAEVILGGEANGAMLKNFQLGNSPREYCPSIVRGKKIILATTNGTKAIKKSALASEILVGSLLNARATATAALKTGRDLFIICAGTRGKFSLEDTIAAGLIIDHIKKIRPSVSLSDIAKTAYHIYYTYRKTLVYPLQISVNGRNLAKLGFERDILYCAQLDKYDFVPRYIEGVITAEF